MFCESILNRAKYYMSDKKQYFMVCWYMLAAEVHLNSACGKVKNVLEETGKQHLKADLAFLNKTGLGSTFCGPVVFPVSHDGHTALGLSSLHVLCPGVHHALLPGRGDDALERRCPAQEQPCLHLAPSPASEPLLSCDLDVIWVTLCKSFPLPLLPLFPLSTCPPSNTELWFHAVKHLDPWCEMPERANWTLLFAVCALSLALAFRSLVLLCLQDIRVFLQTSFWVSSG